MRWEIRIERSAGVHEPQRPFWLVTHRTLAGMAARAWSGRYWSISRRDRAWSSSSVRLSRSSRAARRASILSTHSVSSARENWSGMRTTTRSPSRYADTVRRRRWLRRTSTTGLRAI
jgi:hypothetical protein